MMVLALIDSTESFSAAPKAKSKGSVFHHSQPASKLGANNDVTFTKLAVKR
jgi:hypothetical protein